MDLFSIYEWFMGSIAWFISMGKLWTVYRCKQHQYIYIYRCIYWHNIAIYYHDIVFYIVVFMSIYLIYVYICIYIDCVLYK